MMATSSSGFTSNRSMYSALKLGAWLILALSMGLAQEGTGRLTGTVRDQSGATVPGANVRIVGNGLVRETQTSTAGQFTFPDPPGSTANLEVQAAGFAVYKQTITATS